MTKNIFLLREPEQSPVDPATVEVVNVGGRSYDRYAVRWINKDGEVRATCGTWAFREDAQTWANHLKSLVKKTDGVSLLRQFQHLNQNYQFVK